MAKRAAATRWSWRHWLTAAAALLPAGIVVAVEANPHHHHHPGELHCHAAHNIC